MCTHTCLNTHTHLHPTPHMYAGKKYFLGIFAVSSETGDVSDSCEYGDISDFKFFILDIILY